MKWSGYAEPTWEPSTNLDETAALESYLARTASVTPEEGGDVMG